MFGNKPLRRHFHHRAHKSTAMSLITSNRRVKNNSIIKGGNSIIFSNGTESKHDLTTVEGRDFMISPQIEFKLGK